MKNKSFSIVCIFLLIVLLFTSNVFAVSLNDNNKKTYNLPEFTDEMKQYDKYLIFVEDGGKLFNLVFLVDNDGFFYNTTGGIFCYGRVLLCSTTGDSYYNTRYEVSSGTIAKLGGPITSSSVFICNNNIYTDVNKSDVFFQVSPLAQVVGVELVQKKTTREILGVLPLILVVVVSFLGLRKALRMLLSFLRRS